jgi:DNA-binding transcriptional LysR family regulator
VKKLEDYLGARLIDRTTRSIELTPVGREFLPHAARLVTDTTLAVGRVKDQSRLGQGNIIMASIPTMAHHALPAVIRKYTQRYPNNRIRIIESGAFEVNRTVIHENAEFGLTLELERHPQLLEQRVLREPFMFFCREDHPLGKSRSVNWNDLQQAELIMMSSLSGNRVLLDHELARKRLSLNGKYEVEHLSTAIGLVAAGVGTALLPFSTIQEGTYPGVRRIPLVGPVIRRNVVLIRRKGQTLSPATQIFYEMLAEQLESASKRPLTRRSG